MTFAIVKAERKATPALIGLWGPSGSGKTFSALRIARGLVGPKGKIGVIDTENRRAEFYANVAGGWDHLDLQPPFGPARYTEAFKSFEDAGGYGCIIVDSMSHAWEGEGGVLDIANSQTTKGGRDMTGLAKWNAPKMAYKRMLNGLLRAPFHVIFCLRAKEAVRQKGKGNDAEIESLGLAPICEKNFIYEMTVSVLLGPDHKPLFNNTERFRCSPEVPAVKAPNDIWGAIKPGEYLSEETGQAIQEWVGGGATFDHDAEQLKRTARDIATLGTDRLKQHWDGLNKAQRKILAPHMDEMKSLAAKADEESDGVVSNAAPAEDPFADRFTGNGQAAAE